MGRTWTAIIGSAGFRATATSVIHANFRDVSLLISQANCCRSESSTPWLKGSGTIANIRCKSTWRTAQGTNWNAELRSRKPSIFFSHKVQLKKIMAMIKHIITGVYVAMEMRYMQSQFNSHNLSSFGNQKEWINCLGLNQRGKQF